MVTVEKLSLGLSFRNGRARLEWVANAGGETRNTMCAQTVFYKEFAAGSPLSVCSLGKLWPWSLCSRHDWVFILIMVPSNILMTNPSMPMRDCCMSCNFFTVAGQG